MNERDGDNEWKGRVVRPRKVPTETAEIILNNLSKNSSISSVRLFFRSLDKDETNQLNSSNSPNEAEENSTPNTDKKNI